jgi:ABC-type lipoprotein export system ATPase subunit
MNINKLICQNVRKSFQQGAHSLPVLHDISASFAPGHSYAITGASGSGKSTLLHLLAGLDAPCSGSVSFNNVDLHALGAQQKNIFLNKTIGLVFQSPYLIKELSVLENVMLKGLIAGTRFADCKKEAQELLYTVKLEDKLAAYPGQLSGGQQQRVALARALMNKPLFLLADEPTGNLDAQTGELIVELLLTVQKAWGVGLIVSTHDRDITQQMRTRYELQNGLLHVP